MAFALRLEYSSQLRSGEKLGNIVRIGLNREGLDESVMLPRPSPLYKRFLSRRQSHPLVGGIVFLIGQQHADQDSQNEAGDEDAEGDCHRIAVGDGLEGGLDHRKHGHRAAD